MTDTTESQRRMEVCAAAVAGSSAVALIATAIESWQLVQLGAPAVDALSTSGMTYALVAAVGAFFALVIAGGVRGSIDRWGAPHASTLAAACVTFVGGGASMWAVADFLRGNFGSPSTDAIGTALAAAALAIGSATAVRQTPQRGPTVSASGVIYALGGSAVLLAGILGFANPDFVAELRPLRFVAVPLTAAGGVLAALHLLRAPKRLAIGLGIGLASPLAMATLVAVATAPAPETSIAVGTSAGLVKVLDLRAEPARPIDADSANVANDSRATCSPGTPMPSPDAVARDAETSDERPDIVFLTVDSLRWDHTSLAGYERDTTPNLERLASDGAVFARAYPPASSTRQTFRGLFTGLHPSLVKMPDAKRWALALPDGQETLASYLGSAGYATAAIMTATNTLSSGKNAMHGFEVVDETPRTWWDDRSYSAPLMVDRIIAHLSTADDERPKFAWAHLMEPHQKYHPGPDPKSFGAGATARYNAAIHFVDGELGRMIDYVRSPARRDHTWLFITADHGHAFKEHGNRFHGHTVYEEEIRVPLIVFGPGVQGRRFDVPVSLLHLFPTILSVAGVEPFAASCGVDLTRTLTGKEPMPRAPVFVEQIADASNDAFHVAWFDMPLKLLVRPTSRAVELYDLAADPEETNNLAVSRKPDAERLTNDLVGYLEARGMNPEFYGLTPDE